MSEYFQLFYVELMYGSAYIITEVIFVLGTVVLLEKFQFSVKYLTLTAIKTIALWAYVLLANGLVYGLTNSVYAKEIVFPLGVALYAIFFSRYRTSSKIVMSTTYYAAFILSLSISEAISNMFESKMNLSMQTPLASLIVTAATAAQIIYYKRFRLDKFKFIPFTGTALAVLLAVISYLVESLSSLSVFAVSREFRILFASAFFVIEIASYYLLYRISSEYNENLALQVMHKQSEDERELFRLSQRNLEDLKIIRHEIKNHYAYMKLLFETQQYDKANEFFSDFESRLLPSLSFTDSGNSTVNTIMNLEMLKAKEQNLRLDTRYCAVSKNLPFEDIELTSVLTNLIDNAIEACTLNKQLGVIEVDVTQRECYLFIKVSNPVKEKDREEILSLKTKKSNPQLHGYGTKIVSKIVEKYNGSAHYEVKDGRFVADIMMALNAESN